MNVSQETAALDAKYFGLTHSPKELREYLSQCTVLMAQAVEARDTKGYFAAVQLNFQLRAQLGMPMFDS